VPRLQPRGKTVGRGMTYCAKSGCRLTPWRRGWCYTHWRISQGFFFDGKSFVKAIHKLRGTDLSKGKSHRRNTAESARNSAQAAASGQQLSLAAGEDLGAWLVGKTPEPKNSGSPVGLHAFGTQG
jgi:hypothetical protein